MMQSTNKDARVYANLQQLMRLKHYSGQFSFRPAQLTSSKLAGKHISQFRGRGLNFEEFRHYQIGDDIRALDWRVTMRTRQPHVRVYSEEKDLPVVLVIDQRLNMFFSSQDTMKSVVAAELASLVAWRVVKESDRVGALIFNDSEQCWVAPQRSTNHTRRLVNSICEFNQQLSIDQSQKVLPSDSLNQALIALQKVKLHGALIVCFSDLKGFNQPIRRAFQLLQQRNDVMVVGIHDPLEKKLDNQDSLLVSDGELQLELANQSKEMLTQYSKHTEELANHIRTSLINQGVALYEVGTQGNHISQFHGALTSRKCI